MSASGVPVGPATKRSKSAQQIPRVTPYEQLKQAILSGEFRPGQPLVENTLAMWCQTSRTPVREALRRLEQDGLIDGSDRGLVVRKRSPEEILDIYETRIVLEGAVARVAAERRTEHDIRLMRLLGQKFGDVSGSDATVEADRQFHRAVWKASHNESLLDLLERLSLQLAREPATTLSAPGRRQAADQQHKQLVDAIEERNTEAAQAIALSHFAEARDIRLELFANEISAG